MKTNKFVFRHIGPSEEEIKEMCENIGVTDLDDLINKTIPSNILRKTKMKLPAPMTESEYLNYIREIALKNKLYRSFIGCGYYRTHMPAVIQRNILENPGWYTSYTPYQAEISQGRLEALLIFQTVITELTKMQIANASLLDEATAAAEAMLMMYNARKQDLVKNNSKKLFVDSNIFPQTLAVIKTRAFPHDIEVVVGDFNTIEIDNNFFGVILQYPGANGIVSDYSEFVSKVKKHGIMVAVAADILSLALLVPPGQWGADIVFGSTQRLGLPMFYGGPHAGYFATKDEYKRLMPGRIIGVSKDTKGRNALRMALQTREQHIKRERATSNICTAQALLAIMSGMYVVYHGKEGLQEIASYIHKLTGTIYENLSAMGYHLNNSFFDTLTIELPNEINIETIKKLALDYNINFYYPNSKNVRLSIDELTNMQDVRDIITIFSKAKGYEINKINECTKIYIEDKLLRKDDFLTQKVFNSYRSETELMRYIKKLEKKDIALNNSMIPLGSCTMKLNAAAELLPLSWPEFSNIHPFVPDNQAQGYLTIIEELGNYLKEITGLDAISFQPNSGAAGEYAGLMIIKKYFEKKGDKKRNTILIPSSAHGTNPASAAMAGFKIIVIKCDDKGNIDINDLAEKCELNKDTIAGLMITYPSTHGVFEEKIKEITSLIHNYGGLVYMDGANMNAQVGFTSPAEIDADICHLNLHKTFAIPHGGGGPGAGPILVKKELEEFLPNHPFAKYKHINGVEAVAAAPFGSPLILLISHAYIRMMGTEGLELATKVAILNANYISKKLSNYFPTLYTGKNGFVAHEHIVDCRQFRQKYNITEIDIAKRLIDFGFHAPTVSFPVHGTLMIEPTESESKQELDRFIEAMIKIHEEIIQIEHNKEYAENNLLKNAPHCIYDLIDDDWNKPYSKQEALYPLPWVKENKFYPPVSRIDDAYGDRFLFCTCNILESSDNI
ncbi:MAG: aminomethyl-transferring glycine dehydrogenase [Bacteroidales bacterium]|nr:aminomethyl-transferring glycine dehydrogenase [Bacteroidales bacterium]